MENNSKGKEEKKIFLQLGNSEILPKVIFFTVVGGAIVIGGYLIYDNISKKITESKKTQSLILIDNGTITIKEDTEKKLNPDVKNEKYSIVMFDDTKWLIAVNCIDSDTYAEFVENNIYFTDENKIVFDTIRVNEESYEYFKEHIDETNKGSSRVRKG